MTLEQAAAGAVLNADFAFVLPAVPIETEQLPLTGLRTDRVLLWALLLLAVGGLVVVVTRRREDEA